MGWARGRAMSKLKVYDWFYSGEQHNFAGLDGWHCHVYADDETKAGINLLGWMKTHLKKDRWDCDLKFNSGTPMYLIRIKDEADAMFFKLSLM